MMSCRFIYHGAILAAALLLSFIFPAWGLPRADYNVRDYGAIGDGATMDTAALQKAIEACHAGGGGTVWFPAGVYRSGGLILKDHVTLYLDNGAVLLGSDKLDDYPKIRPDFRSYTDRYTHSALIYGEGLQHVAIHGQGTIDGQGGAFSGDYLLRPFLIRFVGCTDVSLRDVTLTNPAMWTVHFLACDRVNVDGIVIRSRCNKNNDGIDIDSCRGVRVANCDISSGDDAIVLKSTSYRLCEDVVITNCVLSTDCNAIKLGTESHGGFKRVSVSNCVIRDTHLAGVAIEMVDGGVLDGVAVSNLAMENVSAPVFIRLGNRARTFEEGQPVPGVGRLENVSISNITATGADRIGCSITGQKGYPVRNIAIDQVRIEFAGGGTRGDARSTPRELPDKYPEYNMFGVLPAYGFYVRHAENLRFNGIELSAKNEDARPAMLFEDVKELSLSRVRAQVFPRQNALLRMIDVQGAHIVNSVAAAGTETFLRLEGPATRSIYLHGNDLRNAVRRISREASVPQSAIAGDARYYP